MHIFQVKALCMYQVSHIGCIYTKGLFGFMILKSAIQKW